jgi:sugar phosphate isomerase/epimerase
MNDSSLFCIGNQTAFSAPPLVAFGYAIKHGFDAFEFFPDGGPSGRGWAAVDLSAHTRAFIRAKAAQHGIRLSVHASLAADPRTAEGTEAFDRDADFARDIGARTVIIHLVPSDLDAFAEGTLAVLDRLVPAGMILSIENTVAMAPEDFDVLFARLGKLDPPRAQHIGMCLDIGHANLHAGTRNDYLAYVDRLSPRVPIVHVHAHENRGDRDSHMTLFTGHAADDPSGVEGVVRRLHQRRFAGSLILEQWPEPPSLLLTARDRLRAMIELITADERRTCGIGS